MPPVCRRVGAVDGNGNISLSQTDGNPRFRAGSGFCAGLCLLFGGC